ncbi:hypothetical protein HHL22_00365 [Hymenobacter sp. RP-2-7]|uniref:Uncharacterized protein n=1 Tax=Hymenobacter polaris TaxID=2682546 RepID=A0A7Y0AAB3_9BACT|nr:hypothetical protein [Hymenobacter polaris]NML63653.1 hypothetical protein [Hymenobacter polaris]
MKKFKGQSIITKKIASKIAEFNKNSFARYINDSNRLKQLYADIHNDKVIEIEIVSFSSTYDFNEQVLSILSFIKNIGIPISWTLYSDGTHTQEQINRIESAFTFLKLIKTDIIENYIRDNIKDSLIPYKNLLISYAKKLPLGKRLFLYLNYSIKYPTLFIDSDIVFYQKSQCIINLLNDSKDGWFLPDADYNNLDSRYVANTTPQHYQVNGGFFLLNKELVKVSNGLDFLKILDDKYEYFSDQTVFHIIISENNFMPLDPRIFILNSGDQFDFSYLHPKETIAIRHYTGPVRHKMWQQNWKWHLSFTH